MNAVIDTAFALPGLPVPAAPSPTAAGSHLVLTADQQAAKAKFLEWLLEPNAPAFVLSGYSGCGKSTLVTTLIDEVPNLLRTARLVSPNFPNYEIELTATTNKAAENLGHITGMTVSTIHSKLGLRVMKDYDSGVSTLQLKRGADKLRNVLLFIDEASYIDNKLLAWIFRQTEYCKICFIGDPAQLAPVNSVGTPVFNAKFPGAELKTVVRQAEGNPIVELSTQFRHTVNTGEFFSFKPDGYNIRHLSRPDFCQHIIAEFARPDWKFRDSKILGWTNRCVVNFNKFAREHAKGDPEFAVGDYAVCNNFMLLGASKFSIKTDQMVQITSISEEVEQHGVLGKWFEIDGVAEAFMPHHRDAKKQRLTQARQEETYEVVKEIEDQWIDLRAAYACTINKSQGSTFDAVYIDLDDVARCNSGDQIARMLYVAVSRARHFVYLTGDLA